MLFTEKAVDGRPPALYYLTYRKREIHAEDTWEPIEGIIHLRLLLKKYYSENLDKPTVISPSIDKGALPP